MATVMKVRVVRRRPAKILLFGSVPDVVLVLVPVGGRFYLLVLAIPTQILSFKKEKELGPTPFTNFL